MNDDSPPGVVNPAVVDTDVLSFLQKGDTRRDAYAPILAGRTLVISFQTVAEQLRWAAEKNWGDRRRGELEEYLKRFLVYPYSIELAREWAEIMAAMAKAGRQMKAGDGWIAATARLIGAPLVTHNRKDFEPVPGLTVISFAATSAELP